MPIYPGKKEDIDGHSLKHVIDWASLIIFRPPCQRLSLISFLMNDLQ